MWFIYGRDLTPGSGKRIMRFRAIPKSEKRKNEDEPPISYCGGGAAVEALQPTDKLTKQTNYVLRFTFHK
jgi:hypothetical protein